MLAYRLAEAGKSVCVLERGKPYPPGSFPRGPRELAKAFWDPSKGLYGMFNVWSFKGIGALVSSGLGGGSLIYANVLLRKPEKWFVQEDLAKGGYEYWPVTRADLDPHYDTAEIMLGGQEYPFEAITPKTRAYARGRREARARVHAPEARSHVRQPERGAGDRRADPARSIRTCTASRATPAGSSASATSAATSARRTPSTSTTSPRRSGRARRSGHAARCARSRRAGSGYAVRYVEHDPADEGQRDRDERPARASRARADLRPARALAPARSGRPSCCSRAAATSPGSAREAAVTRFGGNGDLLTFALGADRAASTRTAGR